MAKGRKSKRVTRDQAAVWMKTVITPIANFVRLELDRARRKRWSFKHKLDGFDSLLPVRQMIAPVFLPNLDQTVRAFPDLGVCIKQHDESLSELLAACRAARAALVGSKEFKRVVGEAEDPDHAEYFADYVVNGIEVLPHDYGTKPIWDKHGTRFLGLREEPGLDQPFDALDTAGSSFRKSAERLSVAAESLRDSLADKFGLPAVDPGEATV